MNFPWLFYQTNIRPSLWLPILYQTSWDGFLFFFKLGCSTEEFRSDILAVFLLSCLHCFKFVYSKAKSVKCNQTELILKFCTAVLLLYPSICLISLLIKNIFFYFLPFTFDLTLITLVDDASLLDLHTHNKQVAGYHQSYCCQLLLSLAS